MLWTFCFRPLLFVFLFILISFVLILYENNADNSTFLTKCRFILFLFGLVAATRLTTEHPFV